MKYLIDLGIHLGSLVPYALGSRIIKWVSTQKWIQNLFCRKDVSLIKEFLLQVDPSSNKEDAISHYLVNNILPSWRFIALNRCSSEEFSKWVTISGTPALKKAYDNSQGLVVINSHFGVARLITWALAREGYPILSIEAGNLLGRLKIKDIEKVNVIEIGGEKESLSRELFLANRALKKGELVHLAGDGNIVSGGIPLPFMGRLYQFTSSFAELALLGNASVIPVFASMNMEGVINIEFLPPLEPGDDSMPHKKRVEHLIGQYVHLLEEKYRQDPGNIRTAHLKHYLSLPPVNDGRIAPTHRRVLEQARLAPFPTTRMSVRRADHQARHPTPNQL